MRKLRIMEHISLDGVIQASGEDGFPYADWTVPYRTPAGRDALLAEHGSRFDLAAINTAAVKPGDTVAVIGVGGVGLNVISGARLAGAVRIIAIDTQPRKEFLSRQFGATDFIDASKGDAVEAVLKLLGTGVDHAFEVIGLKSTSQQAIKMARLGGGAYLIGLHKAGSTIEVDVLTDLIVRQVVVRGVYMGSSNIKHDIPMYAQLYLDGRFNLDDLISKEIHLSEINEAYEELKKGEIARSVITSF